MSESKKGWTRKSSPRDVNTNGKVSRFMMGGAYIRPKAQVKKKKVLGRLETNRKAGQNAQSGALELVYSPTKRIGTSPRKPSISPPTIPQSSTAGLKRTHASTLRDASQACAAIGASISPKRRSPYWPPPKRKQKTAAATELASGDVEMIELELSDSDIDDIPMTAAPSELKGSQGGMNIIHVSRRKQTSARKLERFPPKPSAFPAKIGNPLRSFEVAATFFSHSQAYATSKLSFYSAQMCFPSPWHEVAVRFEDILKLAYFPKTALQPMNRSVLAVKFRKCIPSLKGYGGYDVFLNYVCLLLPDEILDYLKEVQEQHLEEGVLEVVEHGGNFGELERLLGRVKSGIRVLRTQSYGKPVLALSATSLNKTCDRKRQARLSLEDGFGSEGGITLVSSRVTLKSMDVLTWPPPPAKGAITLNTADLMRLQQGEFLNDQVIDFYLKYLIVENPNESVHVFNSHFYKRGSHKPKDVLRWTKGINVFKKRFLLVPVHDHAHWLLAIVCFPGGVIKGQPSLPTTADSTDEERALAYEDARILFFDSLSTSTTTAARRIRQFLQEIWNKDNEGQLRDFSQMEIVSVDVPQQDNYWDCGVFVMQYAEEFLTKLSPHPSEYSSAWFPLSKVKRKRKEFLRLVHKLAEDQQVELDPQVVRYLKGLYEGARTRTELISDAAHVQTIERDGVIMLDESDNDDSDHGAESDGIEITAGADDQSERSSGDEAKEESEENETDVSEFKRRTVAPSPFAAAALTSAKLDLSGFPTPFGPGSGALAAPLCPSTVIAPDPEEGHRQSVFLPRVLIDSDHDICDSDDDNDDTDDRLADFLADCT